jgi:ammonia channel protein AmtB
LLQRCQVDDTKVIPLFAGAGSFGLLMVGLFHGGELQGGYYGIDSGPYAFQHAVVSLLMQVAGILTCLGIGALTGLVMFWLLSRTTGLQVLEHEREQGLDRTFWQICKSDPSNREP